LQLRENFSGMWTELSERIRYDSMQDSENNGLYNNGAFRQNGWIRAG